MKINDPGRDTVSAATNGELAAIDALLLAIEPGVFNLAVRMLGNREDAADAAQEILLKAVTHLSSFRQDAAFTTWVFQIARNHLLTTSTKSKESPETSLEAIEARLGEGLAYGQSLGDTVGTEQSLSPEDKLAARQIAIGCTQGMLMTLNREERLAYILDTFFDLSSDDAADVLDINAAAYRQRVSRTRARLNAFATNTCGLASETATCRCEKQLPAAAFARANTTEPPKPKLIAIKPVEIAEAEKQFDAIVRIGDAAALFRAHPEYQSPDNLRAAIRSVLRVEGYLGDERAVQ
jgi:RNA polymerase sigma factor (sigma-70 family)